MCQIIKINDTFLYQVVELQNRLSEESKKADKLDFEYKRLKEKVDSLQKEKDVSIYMGILVLISVKIKKMIFNSYFGYVNFLFCL